MIQIKKCTSQPQLLAEQIMPEYATAELSYQLALLPVPKN
jgi:hypothetical protein